MHSSRRPKSILVYPQIEFAGSTTSDPSDHRRYVWISIDVRNNNKNGDDYRYCDFQEMLSDRDSAYLNVLLCRVMYMRVCVHKCDGMRRLFASCIIRYYYGAWNVFFFYIISAENINNNNDCAYSERPKCNDYLNILNANVRAVEAAVRAVHHHTRNEFTWVHA